MSRLYKGGWVIPFDWPAWQDEAERLVKSNEGINAADVETIRKLLTTHLRKERFSEGHLRTMMTCGHIADVLRRVRRLREEGAFSAGG